MISDWTSPDGLRAIERMGLPATMGFFKGHLYVFEMCVELRECVEPIALALLRDKAIAFLREHGCSTTITGECYVYRHGKIIASNLDIDRCLIAAVLEVGNV